MIDARESGSAIGAMATTAGLASLAITAAFPTTLWFVVLPMTVIGTLLAGGLIGFPLYLIARRLGWINGWAASIAGLITGVAIPAAILLPDAQPGDSLTPVALLLLGIAGAASGLVFITALRWSEMSGRERMVRSGAGLAAVAAGYFTLWLMGDHSCHNPLRNGAGSASPEAVFDVDLGPSDAGRLIAEVERFGREHSWSVRTERDDPRYPGLFEVSLCRESGTILFVDNRTAPRRALVGAYQPQGGDGWKPGLRMLHDDLRRDWPNAIVYRDALGERTRRRPNWLATGPAAAPSAPSPPPRESRP